MDDPVSGGTRIATLDDLDLHGNRVLVRCDINAPIEQGRVAGTSRLAAAARSIRALIDRGAGVVVLAHQGRPGREDFVPLEEHAGILADALGHPVEWVPHVEGPEALDAVRAVEPGEVLLLENVRGAEGETDNVAAEEHAQRAWVEALADEVSCFVLDAFPACHRSHASIVAFPVLLPSAAGPLLQSELEALARATEAGQERSTALVLGGAKVEDALKVIHHHLKQGLADTVLAGGLVGELMLAAQNFDLGGPTREVLAATGAIDHLERARTLAEDHGDRIVAPVDLAQDLGGREEIPVEDLPAKGKILDIGEATGQRFAEAIQAADTVVLNGPMGAYEQDGFEHGTAMVLDAMARSDAFTLVGGGHTITAMEKLGHDPADYDHVSLAGGALITYLTGGVLPGLEALEQSARRFRLLDRRARFS